MKINLIRKKRYFLAIAFIAAMACLSACAKSSYGPESPVHEQTVKEQTEKKPIMSEQQAEIRTDIDTTAPEGLLKGYFLAASQKVVPGDFVENVIDSSGFTEGFRNIRMIYDEMQTKEILKKAIARQDITKTELDFTKIFELNWNTVNDCYEEHNSSNVSIEKTFEPKENGLYELEVVASDIYGNASVAKVYVLYDKAVTTLSEFEDYVSEMIANAETSSQLSNEVVQAAPANGFDRGKAEQAFAKVNVQRSANGVQELIWDEALYELACARAQEIVSNFSHQRPDGSYVGDVIIRQYGAMGCGENIASNYTSTTNLINGWLNSQGHKENMLNSSFTAGVMACYCHNGSYYWVNLFEQ